MGIQTPGLTNPFKCVVVELPQKVRTFEPFVLVNQEAASSKLCEGGGLVFICLFVFQDGFFFCSFGAPTGRPLLKEPPAALNSGFCFFFFCMFVCLFLEFLFKLFQVLHEYSRPC